MPANTANSRSHSDTRRRLLRIYYRLLEHFGPRHWWPAETAWEMMVGAILTQNTAWSNVEKALAELKAANVLTLRKIASLPRRRLEKLIHSSGFYHQKAERLQRFARHLRDHPDFYKQLIGEPSKTRNETDVQQLRQRLLSLKGIGPETADSILLYAGAYPVFVVDAYTRRIGQRLGLFRFNEYDRIQSFFERALPQKAALYNEYHALLVWLAKGVCRSHQPLCGECPLASECKYPTTH